MGQFLEDLELACLERLAVTTFPYHHNSTNFVTATVSSQPLCSELQVHRLISLSSVALANPWLKLSVDNADCVYSYCANVEHSNVIFSLYMLLVAVGHCRDLVMSCNGSSLCRLLR